jgi:hypothetical protein
MEKERVITSRRLAGLLREGLQGHHLLFEPEEIRAAFASEDVPLSKAESEGVARALLAAALGPLATARRRVATLSPAARDAFIRLYFKLLDKVGKLPGEPGWKH